MSIESSADRRPVVVVAAHGSRAEPANAAHRDLVDELAAAVDHPVRAAFLELAEPTIPDAIDAAAAGGARTVLVVPYFLHPGRHLTEDLPAIVAEAGARHPGTEIRLLGSFGAQPGLLDVLVAQVTTAIGSSEPDRDRTGSGLRAGAQGPEGHSTIV